MRRMRERVRFRLRMLALTLVAGLLLSAPVQANSSPSSRNASSGFWPRAAFDILVLRPLGLVSSAVGATFFLPVVLISIPNGPAGREEAWDRLISAPLQLTFERPLGDF